MEGVVFEQSLKLEELYGVSGRAIVVMREKSTSQAERRAETKGPWLDQDKGTLITKGSGRLSVKF